MFLTVISWLLVIIFIIIRYCKRPKNYPPGPPFLPFVGTWYTIPAQGTEFALVDWVKRYGSIVGHKLFSQNMVFVTDEEEIIAGLKHPNFQKRVKTEYFNQRYNFKTLGFFFTDGEQFAEMRRFTIRYLTQTFNEKLQFLMHEEMQLMFSRIKSGCVVNIDPYFIKFDLSLFLSILIGCNATEFESEKAIIRKITHDAFIHGRVFGVETVYSFMKVFFHNEYQENAITLTHKFLSERLEEHKQSFNESNIRDYMDAYLAEQNKEKKYSKTNFYTDEELISCCFDMVQASAESVGNTFKFVLLHVALNPETQYKLHNEIDTVLGKYDVPTLEKKSRLPYCEAVVTETMRYSSIAPLGVTHVASQDTEFFGYTIPKDSSIVFGHYVRQHDPRVFPEPDKFLPDRFLLDGQFNRDIKMTNFGMGKRACIAERISKQILFVSVAYFFQKYSIKLSENCRNPTLHPQYGFTEKPYPFDIIITERQ